MAEVLDGEFLKKWYIDEKYSTWAIEKRFGYSRTRVYKALKKHGVPVRTLSASHIRYARTGFSGDSCEKAYLLGFAIGDLRVRRLNKGGGTISIGCGSTKPAQIELIEKLFSGYGRVWKGAPDKRGAVNIEAFLNDTFSFLLPDAREYKWCANAEGTFFAFLAGFTDAEGSFFVSNGKAFISWGNYNVTILRFIRSNLLKFGIDAPALHRDSLKGFVGSHGYPRKKNYWHLTITRKAMLEKLLNQLSARLRHADKHRALVRVRQNLIMRGLSV